MFDLSMESILAKTQRQEFEAGREYYRSGRIKSVQFNQQRRSFTSVVFDSKPHTQRMKFDAAGNLTEAECSCPVGNDGWGLCRHMVTVLLLIQEKDSKGFFRELHFRQAAKDIFNFFSDRQIALKSAVVLEPVFELSRATGIDNALLPSLKFRIGQERLYIVKDIKKLLFHMENNMDLNYGKRFTYSPSRHEFKGKDLELAEMLKELYETEKLIEGLGRGRMDASIFSDGRVYLTDRYLKRFFEIYENTPFRGIILGNENEGLTIKKQDMPVSFLLTNDGPDLVLNIEFEGAMLPLTADGEYFCFQGVIHRISKQQSEYLKPFYMAMMYQKGRKLRFIEEDKQRFVSEILPFAEKAGSLIISEQVQSTIQKLPLSAEVYLDRDGSDITADVRFMYGDNMINPFLPVIRSSSTAQKLLIREIKNEEAILDILGMADFKVKEGRIHLTGDDNIYDFVFRLVPLLQDYAIVYYSESLRNMKLKQSLSFSAKFRLNNDTNLLEFSFGAEGIDPSELAEIFASIRKKKKYYQLRNGSFINLEANELIKANDFMEKLEVDTSEIGKEFIELPRFRAAYLDQSIRETGIHNVERDMLFKELVRNIKEPEDMSFRLPDGLRGSLRDYQKFGFKWLKTLKYYEMGGILADDMGLGKTLQILALLLSDKQENGAFPSLVIVPSSLVFNWCAEIEKFAPGLKYVAVTGNKENRRKLIESIPQCDVVITSYPLIRRDIDLYRPYTFRYCILDEAQHIKNGASRNARSAKLINARTRFALTGTPIENNLYELWSIFDFVLPGYLYSYRRFEEKYVRPASGEDGGDLLADLNKQIRPFVLRRLKKDVLRELPEKMENTMTAELTDEQKKIYMAYLSDIRGEIKQEIEASGFERSRIRILAALTRLRQLCCHPSLFVEDYHGGSGKLQMLEEIIQESVSGGHRILLFSQFTAMLQIVRKRLDELEIPYLYLDGATPVSERGFLVNSFNEGAGKIFLISLKAGGTGLNLTGADTVIHYDPWWNPAVEDQATDRSYRIGQKKSVYVIKLVTRGTIEEKILALQDKKRSLIDAVIQPGETLLSKMTPEEIQSLFD
ncbi:MAG: DEAD/DEAH box helicase [Clostridiaceae bacterium]|nr:DEAD/DEAH box helicase [Clostridiaceae bacterium]